MKKRLPWFPCNPEKLLGALAGMAADQKLVYVILLLRIYEVGGACQDPIEAIAQRCGINVRRASEALRVLEQMKKLRSIDGGIMNPVAEGVLEESTTIQAKRKQAGSEGGRKAAENRKRNQQTPGSPATAEPYTSTLTKEDSLSPRGERAPGLFPEAELPSAAMPNPPLDLEADYYRRGREVLGKTAGGMLRKLLEAKGGNIALARAAIEQASTRGDARQYVGAMVRTGGPSNRSTGKPGFAGLTRKLLEQRYDEQHHESQPDGATVPAAAAEAGPERLIGFSRR